MSNGSVWRKTLVYLGLVEEPEEHDEMPERFVRDEPSDSRSARSVGEDEGGKIRPLRVPEPGAPHVRAMTGVVAVRAVVVEVHEFDDVATIGDRYRNGQPVLFDLAAVDRDVARRVLDFVAGVTYAARGRLRRAGQRVFVLIPDGVELPADERRRLADLGYQLEETARGPGDD